MVNNEHYQSQSLVPSSSCRHQPINGIDFLDAVVSAGIKVHGD
jgi:hypothetical protein